jgi:hypothetical protein
VLSGSDRTATPPEEDAQGKSSSRSIGWVTPHAAYRCLSVAFNGLIDARGRVSKTLSPVAYSNRALRPISARR